MREWYEKNKDALARYDAALDPIKQLRDVTKSAARSINSLNKDEIVGYLQRPNSYEKQLRNASWYLVTRSQVYQRIIMYYSSMFCLDARTIIPNYDLQGNNNDKKILKSYNDTITLLRPWNITNEFFKIIATMFVQDVSYNVFYADDTGLFFLPLPADYCRILTTYPSGDLVVAFNMRYFSSHDEYLEYWGSPFTEMWNDYQSTGDNWQTIPQEYSACFKYRSYDWSTIIPPFSGIFGSIIDLLDAEDIEAISQKQEIFKFIYVKLKTITNASGPDMWQIDPDTVVQYFNRMCEEALPSYTSAAVVPGNDDIGVVDFSSNEKTSETNRILNGTKNVLNASGGAQVLNSATISGSTAYKYSIIADSEFALVILPQIEGWFNRIAALRIKNPSKIRFMHVTRFTREDYRKELLEDAQNSLPTKLSIMALNGYDPIDVLSMNHIEEDILHLADKFNKPLNTSYTQSSSDNTKDIGDLTDEGEASRDKEIN